MEITAISLFTIASILGNLIAQFIKEYILSVKIESLKQKNSLKAIYQKYKDPILLSARELNNRVNEICKDYPTVFLNSNLLSINPAAMEVNSANDPYYQKYPAFKMS